METTLAVPNIGSLAHNSIDNSSCNPCAFLHKDPRGCLHGVTCKFCHLCPPGELKRRKKEKVARMRAAAAAEAESAAQEAAAAAAEAKEEQPRDDPEHTEGSNAAAK